MKDVTAVQVVQALLKRPELLYDVKDLLLYSPCCGPWIKSGDTWGLPRLPGTKEEYQQIKGAWKGRFVATIWPGHPDKWHWNVVAPNGKQDGSGIVDTMVEAANAAAEHLRGHGWIVLNAIQDP